MKCIFKQMLFLFCITSIALIAEQSFVIKKDKKKKVSSIKVLKEQYAKEAGELIKVVPKVHKHMARLQRELIKDLDDLLNNVSSSHVATLSKEQLELRSKNIVQLTHQMQEFDGQLNKICSSLSDEKST